MLKPARTVPFIFIMGLFLFKSSVGLAIPICTPTQVEAFYSQPPIKPKADEQNLNLDDLIEAGAQLILGRHPQLPKDALSVSLKKILQNPSFDGILYEEQFAANPKALYKNRLRYRFTPDQRLFVQIDEKLIQEGSSKKVIQIFQLYRNHWTDAALVVPLMKKFELLNNRIALAQWNQEKAVSKIILHLLSTTIDPDRTHGLPRIFYVAEGEPLPQKKALAKNSVPDELGGVYEDRYDNSLFELFDDPFFLQESLNDRIAVVHQTAVALSRFYRLEDPQAKGKTKWAHQDVKPENFLYRNISIEKQECRIVVITDFSYSQALQELIDTGQFRWGSASASYVDPAHLFTVGSIFDWISGKAYYELNHLGRDPRYVHWYGNSDAEKIKNAWASDAYGIGIISLFALYGTESPLITEAFVIKDHKAPANSILGRTKLFYSEVKKRAAEKSQLNTLDDFLRVSLEIDPDQRASVDELEKGLRTFLMPLPLASDSKEKLSSLSFGPCSAQTPYRNQFEIGDYLICEENPDLYQIWYRVPARDNPYLILEKELPATLTGEQVRSEIQILIDLGVLKKYI